MAQLRSKLDCHQATGGTGNIENAGSSACQRSLRIVTYNMHGFNQGFSTVKDLCSSIKPDIFMLQEHWLTPANFKQFDNIFPEYFTFGNSAMISSIERGILRGRPFGGVTFLIHSNLRAATRTVFSSDRCVIVRVFNYLLVNVYLPCVGTENRRAIVEDIFYEMSVHMSNYKDCTWLLGGDFNCDLDSRDEVALIINEFACDNVLSRCDCVNGMHKVNTYVNEALNCSSCIDYFLTSSVDTLRSFCVIDEGSNLSDHLPVVVDCLCKVCHQSCVTLSRKQRSTEVDKVEKYLRWDHADLSTYYFLTGQRLQYLLNCVTNLEEAYSSINVDYLATTEIMLNVNDIYEGIVKVLNECAKQTVPTHKKQFYKFWWNQELDCLKQESIEAHTMWKSAGKPRNGHIFVRYRTTKMTYKKRIKESQKQETSVYTNDLHEALLAKQSTTFWKCWRAKFEPSKKTAGQVDGLTDKEEIVEQFRQYFIEACSPLTNKGNANLENCYNLKRSTYCGTPWSDDMLFDVALVDSVIRGSSHGKAAGLDNLSVEHLQYSHPVLPLILTKLFNIMLRSGRVPDGFGLSYTVPLPKNSNTSINKPLSVNDFRGISISPVISKIFEKCILDRFAVFFETHDSQFGFKKGMGCSHAIYSVKAVVDCYTKLGTTVNLCALDLKKAFDKMNHSGLYIKLMDRMIPNCLLSLIEHWFSICATCVRFGGYLSGFFYLKCGVRQGGVLSPHFFAVYINDVIKRLHSLNSGCFIRSVCVNVFVYADDIILLAPSIDALIKILRVVEDELVFLDMALNARKSVCIRYGPRFDKYCSEISTNNGDCLRWASTCRYLGVFLVASRRFKISLDNNKRSFYRSFNAIFGQIGRLASEEVIVHLMSVKCLPVLMYGLDACPVCVSDKHSLDFIITRTFMKIFQTSSVDVVQDCQTVFNFRRVSELIVERKRKFLQKFCSCENIICQVLAGMATDELSLL